MVLIKGIRNIVLVEYSGIPMDYTGILWNIPQWNIAVAMLTSLYGNLVRIGVATMMLIAKSLREPSFLLDRSFP